MWTNNNTPGNGRTHIKGRTCSRRHSVVVAVMPDFKVWNILFTGVLCMRISVPRKAATQWRSVMSALTGKLLTDFCNGLCKRLYGPIVEPFNEVCLCASIFGLQGEENRGGTLGNSGHKSSPKHNYWLTSSHVFDCRDNDKTVLQPSAGDLKRYVKTTRHQLKHNQGKVSSKWQRDCQSCCITCRNVAVAWKTTLYRSTWNSIRDI